MEKYCLPSHSRQQEQREQVVGPCHPESLTWEGQAEELPGTDPFLSHVLLYGKAGECLSLLVFKMGVTYLPRVDVGDKVRLQRKIECSSQALRVCVVGWGSKESRWWKDMLATASGAHIWKRSSALEELLKNLESGEASCPWLVTGGVSESPAAFCSPWGGGART